MNNRDKNQSKSLIALLITIISAFVLMLWYTITYQQTPSNQADQYQNQ